MNQPPARLAPGAYRYQPVPDGPHRHEESDARECPGAGKQLIGARVRGKKHKHDGTNCDDWFEIARAGRWELIAVADGAGSKPLSRVGARSACQEAVTALAQNLADLAPLDRADVATWNEALSRPEGKNGAFAADDLESIQQAIWSAVRRAARSVREQAEQLVDCGVAGAKDLACTLLVAAHTTAGFGTEALDFIIACNIGDGMTAALHRNGTPLVLAEPDAGAFAGQTRFLTFDDQVTDANLARKTFVSLCRLRALFVMTDGVADDYDPPREHLARLWADLVVNGVMDLTPAPTDEVLAALAGSPAPSLDAVAALPGLDSSCQVVEPDPRGEFTIRSSAALAAGLGTTIEGLLNRPGLLWAGRLAPVGAPLQGPTAADRLREWLDTYQAQTSFDDRTLVVLHGEDLGC